MRLADEGKHLLEFFIRSLVHFANIGVGKFDRGGKNRNEAGLLNILGDIDDDGTGTTAPGEVKGFFEHPRQVCGIHHQVRMLHDGQGHAVEVRLLERALADELGKHLAGDGDEWNRIHVGVGDGGAEIGRTGATGRHTHADITLDAGITLGGKGSALFVAGQNRANLVGARERLMKFL